MPNLKEETTSEMEHSIGVPMQIIEKIEDVNVKNNFLESIKILEKNGFKTKQIELPFLEYSLPSYYVIAPAECSANLSRYDGIKFDTRCDNPKIKRRSICKDKIRRVWRRSKKKNSYRNLLSLGRLF